MINNSGGYWVGLPAIHMTIYYQNEFEDVIKKTVIYKNSLKNDKTPAKCAFKDAAPNMANSTWGIQVWWASSETSPRV